MNFLARPDKYFCTWLSCAFCTPAFLTAVLWRMHIFSQRHGCNRVWGGGRLTSPNLRSFATWRKDRNIALWELHVQAHLFGLHRRRKLSQFCWYRKGKSTRLYNPTKDWIFTTKSVLISRRLHCASHFESFVQRKATNTCRIVRTLVSSPNKAQIDKCEEMKRRFVHSRRLFLGIF